MRGKILFFIPAAVCLYFLLAVTWNCFLHCQTTTIRKTSDENECHSSKSCFMKLSDTVVPKKNFTIIKPLQEIVVVAAVCDNRINEILVMIKSALITSQTFIKFLVFADESATHVINGTIKLWPAYVLKRMSLDLRSIDFPADNAKEWKQLFQPCAAQRLFLPSLLKNVDSVLYVDTDTLFLSSPLKVWEHFSEMNETQMVAVAPENEDFSEDFSAGGYNKLTKHPYYGDFGINSGVMLMNLTRMRQFGWERYVFSIHIEYKDTLLYGDQDIINILFYFHPGNLYIYSCNYNYRSDHCMYSTIYPKSVCKTAEEQRIHVLHGNRGVFKNMKEPAFKAIYSTVQQYSFGEDLQTLSTKLKKSLTKTLNTDCGKLIFNSLANLTL